MHRGLSSARVCAFPVDFTSKCFPCRAGVAVGDKGRRVFTGRKPCYQDSRTVRKSVSIAGGGRPEPSIPPLSVVAPALPPGRTSGPPLPAPTGARQPRPPVHAGSRSPFGGPRGGREVIGGRRGARQEGAARACCRPPGCRPPVAAPPDMPEEARFPPAKRFRPGCGPAGGRVVMLLTAGGGGGGRRQQSALAQPAASPYPEAVERQRRSLPIFPARGQLLAQLRNLDSAVLIGEWREGLGAEAPPRAASRARRRGVPGTSGLRGQGPGAAADGGGGRRRRPPGQGGARTGTGLLRGSRRDGRGRRA